MSDAKEPEVQMSEEQAAVRERMREQRNLLVTGSAGTGKSTLLRHLIEACDGRLPVTATTGIAAVNVGGMTLHSWAGLGIGDDDAKQIAGRIISKKAEPYERIRSYNRLAIDEISMMSGQLLDKLDWVFRLVRKVDDRPFGGMQLIMFGDFLQLPPVMRDAEDDRNRFCFHAEAWRYAQVETRLLTKVFRQADAGWSAALNEVRAGRLSKDTRAMLLSRHDWSKPVDTMPQVNAVIVFTHNADVDMFNHDKLSKLEAEAKVYEATDRGAAPFIEQLRKHCLAPTRLELKLGAQVMLLKNLDPLGGLANGSIGTVIGFNKVDNLPEVRFANGRIRTIDKAKWEIKNCGETLAVRSQVPLRLAWAITVHKCLHPDTLVETDFGLERIGNIQGFEVATTEGLMSYSEPVSYPPSNGVRIVTSRGYEIRATLEHGFVVSDENGIRRVNAGALVVGDMMRLVRGSAFEDTWSNYLPSLPKGDVREKQHKIDTSLGDDMCEFFGLMVADGTLYKRGFRIAKRHEDVAGRFEALCVKLFECSVKRFTKLNAFHVEVNSTQIASWLRLIGGMKPNSKSIPDAVLMSSTAKQCAFLRGLFEDGGVSLKRGSFSSVEWSTKFEQMSSDVQVMLLRLGIVSSRAKYRGCWRVMIYGANAALFRKKIGFISKFKNDRLAGAGSRHKERGVELTKFVSEQIKSITPIELASVCIEVPNHGRFIQAGFDGFNSQGMTLDKIEVHLKRAFEYGQAYVALSRARTLEGLFIRNGNKDSIRANPEALAFYESI